MQQQKNDGRPLFYQPSPIPLSSQLLLAPVVDNEIPLVVISEVASTMVIDLHTHLLPPSHGSLCLWGVDELLTYVSWKRAQALGSRFSKVLPAYATAVFHTW
jgi:hypothetical protein